jgi:protein O-mannosyl-transferase
MTNIMTVFHRLSQGFSARLIIGILLVLLTAAVYAPVRNHEFINFDDGGYVSENLHVKDGLSPGSIQWAFTLIKDNEIAYWHPVTWLSHMADCELFGVDAGLHHLSNLFYHIINVLLLFLVLNKMTGAVWKSGFVALLFALHPVNVDSVAWIAERKNLLSTSFWMLTLLVYVRYAARPSFFRYGLVLAVFSLGLMAKPMLVTLPAVLLLLDFWPLGRFAWAHAPRAPRIQRAGNGRLILEKIPMLGLSFAAIWLSFISLQKNSQVIDASIAHPVSLRISNALVSYCKYIWHMIRPVDYTIFYPFPEAIPLWQPIAAAIVLILLTGSVLAYAKKKPYLAVGWLWYLGTLVPVIGIIQGGLWPEMADRWAYVPLIGLFIMTAWGIPDIVKPFGAKKAVLVGLTAITALILFTFTSIQLKHWKNSSTLFQHALRVTENNPLAHIQVGICLTQNNRHEKAIAHFKKVLEISPDYPRAHEYLGHEFVYLKDYQTALRHYKKALLGMPSNAGLFNSTGNVYKNIKNYQKACRYYLEAITIDPDNSIFYNNLGAAYHLMGDSGRAIKEFKRAITLSPDYTEAYYNLGLALETTGRINEAVTNYQAAIRLNPDYRQAHDSLAGIMFMAGNMAKAIDHYSRVLRLAPDDAKAHYNIGVAYYQSGRIQQATGHFQEALRLKPDYTQAQNALMMIKGR